MAIRAIGRRIDSKANRRFGNLAGMRQWIEAIIGTLKTSSAGQRPASRRLKNSTWRWAVRSWARVEHLAYDAAV